MNSKYLALLILLPALLPAAAPFKKKPPAPSALDKFIKEANAHAVEQPPGPAGSLWTAGARFENLSGDQRAGHVDDILTILVSEQASAVATGATKSARNSSVSSKVTAAGGPTRPSGPWSNLAASSTQVALDGSGTTSRNTTISNTLTARVTHVLPNGFLVVQAEKTIQVNSEHQVITLRGVVRPVDIQTNNVVQSDQIAQLEIGIDGKGVVGDAIRRPYLIYRFLLGLLPF